MRSHRCPRLLFGLVISCFAAAVHAVSNFNWYVCRLHAVTRLKPEYYVQFYYNRALYVWSRCPGLAIASVDYVVIRRALQVVY